jgi:hypothetical protein
MRVVCATCMMAAVGVLHQAGYVCFAHDGTNAMVVILAQHWGAGDGGHREGRTESEVLVGI